jgi:hypothetical protein
MARSATRTDAHPRDPARVQPRLNDHYPSPDALCLRGKGHCLAWWLSISLALGPCTGAPPRLKGALWRLVRDTR